MTHAQLLDTFLEPVRLCAEYQPKFGQANSLDLPSFLDLYGSDAFYSFLGLNDPRMYAAHRAAGGMTSIYRQIGVGSERLFRAVASNSLELPQDQLDWSYQYPRAGKADGVHQLDARIRIEDLCPRVKKQFKTWIKQALQVISTGQDGRYAPDGVVFEVRQGYKSADSKRQNADLRYASRANQDALLPVVFVMSEQISTTVIERYRREGLLVTTGIILDDPCQSSFALCKCLFDFDLLAFLQEHQEQIKDEIHKVVDALLST